MQVTGLGAVAFVHKHEDIALGRESRRQRPFQLLDVTGNIAHFFAVLLAGGALGSRRGALSLLLYMAWGIIGIPVFAPIASATKGELVHFVLPWKGTAALPWDLSSGGYIVGFVLASFLVGKLAESGWDRRSRVSLAMVLGNLVIYMVGLPWLGGFIASGATIPGLDKTYYEYIAGANVLDKTLRGGLYPFIGGDALKLLLSAMVLPGAWALIGRRGKNSK